VRIVSHVLLRAPLLPTRALTNPLAALEAHPLGPAALKLASAALSKYPDDRAARARRRYAQRAAFRPTPQGLWAGVALGRVVDGPSRVELGEPRASLAASWARLASLGRALLDTEEGWRAARLRQAPSLLRDEFVASWLRFGDEGEARRAEIELDELVARVLDLTVDWVTASSLARRLRPMDGADARALLLQLVDDGLLHHDLEPPLVGSSPSEWARHRLLPLCPTLEPLLALEDGHESHKRSVSERLEQAERALAALPGTGSLQGVLVHEPRAAEIDRTVLTRAAEIAPLLFRLAEALSPPIAEVALVPGLDEALAAAGAVVGEGLIDLAALELGHHGARVDGVPQVERPDAAALAWLVGRVLEAARAGEDEIALERTELDACLPPLATPPTFELQLTPGAPEVGPPGAGWLLGVHAPAGASWGRFAAALGPPMRDALAALREAERVHDAALRVDVSYAPTRALADLCTAPAVRDAALALSSWPEEGAVIASQCSVANDPMSAAHRGFVAAGLALEVAPLHRVRSSTAPPSVYRALLADRLLRQHAPWALSWGPFLRLPWLPRVRLDGFVIAPQSWALPTDLEDAALAEWRRRVSVARHVQVGAEDRLLPVDLDDADDRAALRALVPVERARAHEIWPPLGRELDASGRRLELIGAVVGADEAGRATRLSSLAPCPAPSESRAESWRTIKLFAAPDRHGRLLAEEIGPFVRGRDVLGWFFLPYVDPPSRPHLRLRLRARDGRGAARLAERFVESLAVARSRGDVVAVEVGDYVPEHARYGTPIAPVERVFEADSELVLQLRIEPGTWTAEVALATGLFALARGLGLGEATQLDRVGQMLDAHEISVEEERERLAPSYRAAQRDLADIFERLPPPFSAHRARARATKLGRARALRLLPPLAHVAAVRLCGPDRDAEVCALYLWRRALESRAARRR
jgi:thiopeptide-type bacteriocin biosynthesis protein